MSRAELIAALDEAGQRARQGSPDPATVPALIVRILSAAGTTTEVQGALAGVQAARALLRVTDADAAIELQAGDGKVHAEPAETRGKGPKIDATAATWIGLLGGTLRPWLAFTRGLVVCRAGLEELRWIQTVAERLQRGYQEAREAESHG